MDVLLYERIVSLQLDTMEDPQEAYLALLESVPEGFSLVLSVAPLLPTKTASPFTLSKMRLFMRIAKGCEVPLSMLLARSVTCVENSQLPQEWFVLFGLQEKRNSMPIARSRLTMEARLIDGFLQVLRGHSIEIEMTPQLYEDLKFQLTAVLHDSPSLNR